MLDPSVATVAPSGEEPKPALADETTSATATTTVVPAHVRSDDAISLSSSEAPSCSAHPATSCPAEPCTIPSAEDAAAFRLSQMEFDHSAARTQLAMAQLRLSRLEHDLGSLQDDYDVERSQVRVLQSEKAVLLSQMMQLDADRDALLAEQQHQRREWQEQMHTMASAMQRQRVEADKAHQEADEVLAKVKQHVQQLTREKEESMAETTDLRLRLSHLEQIQSKVEKLSSTTEVLSVALKSQWDAQHAANQHNQDKLSVVLSRVDSVLDRTAAALSTGQSTLQAADDALQQAKIKAATRRAQLQHKRRGKDHDHAEEEEEDARKQPTPTAARDEEQAESEEEPVSQLRPLRPCRRTRGQTASSTDTLPTRSRSATGRRRGEVENADKEGGEEATSAAEKVNVQVVEQPRQQPPNGAQLPPAKPKPLTAVGAPASSAPNPDAADAHVKKRKLSNLPLALASLQPPTAVSDGRAPLQPIGGAVMGSKALVGFSHGATSSFAAAPRSLAPSRNLFMSFLQGANAMKAPKLKA